MSTIPSENQNNESKDYLNRLKNDLMTVENKNREFNSNKIMEENKLKETRAKMIQQLFLKMQKMGVDINNLESINKFLVKLSEQDPDLLELFESAFNNLVGEEDGRMQGAPVRSTMDTNSTRPDVVPISHPSMPTEKTFENIR